MPLVDGGTVRIPRLIGHSNALDLILTGRGVSGDEAQRLGLVNRVTDPGGALDGARRLAHDLAGLPQDCLRNDRQASYDQWGQSLDEALATEYLRGVASLNSRELGAGVARFVGGAGRHGS